MANGNQIDAIASILQGKEPLPEQVSNALIFSAISLIYEQQDLYRQKADAERAALQNNFGDIKIELTELKQQNKLMQQRLDAIEKAQERITKIFIGAAITLFTGFAGWFLFDLLPQLVAHVRLP